MQQAQIIRKQYSDDAKEAILKKFFSSDVKNMVKFSQETGVPYSTLNNWIYRHKKISDLSSSQPPKTLDPKIKYQAILETENMTDTQRSEYCRKQGVYPAHLEQWKRDTLENLNINTKKQMKKKDPEILKLQVENKSLKKELARKDKALAEVSALLILKKKAYELWGGKEDD